ncbi:MAG: hypothetical protein V2B18_01205 [Pseudomonadota bacterium]
MELWETAIFWMQCLSTIFLVAGMFYVASGTADRILGLEAISVRWCGIIVVGLWITTVCFHVMAAAGIFGLPAVVALTVCLVGLVRVTGYRVGALVNGLRQDMLQCREFVLTSTNRFQKGLLVVLGIGAVLVGCRSGLLPPLAWDALTYHAVKAGMWVQNGHLSLMEAPGGWYNHRIFSGGGTIFHALGMLLFHSDFIAGVVDFVHWLCLLPALFLLGRCVGLSRKSAFVSALYCLFVPVVVFPVGGYYVDNAVALTLVLGVAFAAEFLLHLHARYLVMSLAALGVAAGIKLVAALPLCGIVAVVVLRIIAHRPFQARKAAMCGAALLLMAVPIVPWLVQSMHATGYPLSPFPVKVFGITLGESTPVTDWLFGLQEAQPYDLREEANALGQLFRRPFRFSVRPWRDGDAWMPGNYSLLSLVPLSIGVVSLVASIKRRVWVGLLIGVVVGAVWGQYMGPGFTYIRRYLAWCNARFLLGACLPLFAISPLVLGGKWLEGFLNFLLCASVLHLVLGAAIYWQPFEFPYLAGAASATIAAGIAAYSAARLRPPKPALVATALLLALLTCQAWTRTHIRYEAVEKSYFSYFVSQYWAKAAELVDDPSQPRNIAVTGGPERESHNWFMYMFMGRSLQNTIRYVPITESGKILHFGPGADPTERVSYESWLARVHRHGITEVMSFFPASVELGWMRAHPEAFNLIVEGEGYGLFKVKSPTK